METAPLHNTLAEGPDNGQAWWLTTDDGVRIRVAAWNTGQKGTVLIFPGRTEYIEKYGRTAQDLSQRGFSTLCVDWRGQGLAERLTDDPLVGHVDRFQDYQSDVNSLMRLIAHIDIPKPLYLIGHSMGGAIGLRSLLNVLPVQAAVFTGPMWGIAINPLLRPIARYLPLTMNAIGQGHLRMINTAKTPYVQSSPFSDNQLTTDRDAWDYMKRQIAEVPDLSLAGPSMAWLHEAQKETRSLMKAPAPSVPTLTFLGSGEVIVDTDAIRDRMSRWPLGKLREIAGAHEALMEAPDIRNAVVDEISAHFSKYT